MTIRVIYKGRKDKCVFMNKRKWFLIENSQITEFEGTERDCLDDIFPYFKTREEAEAELKDRIEYQKYAADRNWEKRNC